MSTLFINPLASEIHAFIVSDKVNSQVTLPKENIAENFPEFIARIFRENTIEEIWCIVGPGPFTMVRVVTLALNSFAYAKNIPVKGCHFFDVIDTNLSAILEINKEEYLIRRENAIEEIPQNLLPIGEYVGYSEGKNFTDGKTFIEYSEEFGFISNIFEKKPSETRLSPIYFKPPKITWSKKSTSPSSGKTKE